MAKRGSYKKKIKPETIEDTRQKIARLSGLLSRVHGHLGLEGVSFEERWKSLEQYCAEKERASCEKTH